MQVSDDPRVGTELAGYRIEALLSQGAMSVVYLAEDLRLERKVALRLLNAELSADEGFRERFLRESELAGSLDHSNIVPVYEAGEADGLLYVAMGYVEGVDLASLLAGEGRLEPERALLIVTQLAGALDAARWGRGLVHGSLKPSEILVAPATDTTSGERVFLLGFGLRQELPPGAGLAEAAQQLGSVGYLAPEQIEGKPVSPRTDVYALGCVLFECLTGEPPFKGDSPAAFLQAHLHEQPPSVRHYRPGLPAGIDRVIGKAMAKWPEERYSSCAELAACAQAALAPGGEQPERAPRDERLSPAALPPRPRRAVREEMLPSGAVVGGSVVARDSLAQRLGKRGRKSIAAIGLVCLVVALVAGAVWLTGRDTGDVSSATPAPLEAETPTEAAVGAGEGTAEPPPAEAEAPAAPEAEPVAAEPGPVVSLLPGSLVRIDAATGDILARVAIPFPKLLASDGRSVWVLSDEGDSEKLVHVEAATNSVTAVFNADGFAAGGLAVAPTQLAVVGGSAWLGNEWGPVYRFAPGAGAGEAAEIEFVSSGFIWPVAAAGSLWVRGGEGGGGLLRVDPATGQVLARVTGDQVVAVGSGFLWALDWDPEPDALVRIDTETHATVPIGVLEFPWADLTVADGAVWASNPQDNTIRRLDPVTGKEKERIRVGRAPFALAAGAGAVWAAISNGTVARYDIATGRITTIDVGGTPNDLVFARDSVWVVVDELGGRVNRLTRAQYIDQAAAICAEATQRWFEAEVAGLFSTLEDIAAWNEAAARISEEALVELRALTPPKADRAHLNDFYWLLEQQTDVLRRTAMAASHLDHVSPADLSAKRVDLTHQKDALEPGLQFCPVHLPA